MSDKPAAIPMANYLAFMELVQAAGGGKEAAEKVAALLAAGPAEEELDRLKALVAMVAQAADERGFNRGKAMASTAAAPPPATPKSSRWTPEQEALIKTWRGARGAVMPEVIREYIGWRVVDKGETKSAMMKRFGIAVEAVRKAAEWYEHKHHGKPAPVAPSPKPTTPPVAAGRAEPIISRPLHLEPRGGPIEREGQPAVAEHVGKPAETPGAPMPGYFIRPA